MQVNFTFKNVDSSEELKNRATEKSEKIKKYMRTPIYVNFIFYQDKLGHCVEINVSGDGHQYSANADAKDYFSAIDDAMDKVVVQLKKHKDKMTDKKGAKRVLI